MAKSLDPANIFVASASGGTVSPFDCSSGPFDDNDSGAGHDHAGADGGWDDSDSAAGC